MLQEPIECPFCQQKLPDGSDAQYQQDIDDIAEFQATYTRETDVTLDTLQANLQDVLAAVDVTEYKDKIALLKSSADVAKYKAEQAKLQKEADELTSKATAARRAFNIATGEIAELNKQVVNT